MSSKPVNSICLVVAMALVSIGPCQAQSKPVVLITADEAKLPRQPDADLSFRAGISRGPAIDLLSPKASIQSPVHLQLKFVAHGGAQIDQGSLKLVDLTNPTVDLTGRVKDFAHSDGVDVPEAEIPPGTYSIHAEIKDNDGRVGSLTFTIKVAKP